jgi:hypothetical protein
VAGAALLLVARHAVGLLERALVDVRTRLSPPVFASSVGRAARPVADRAGRLGGGLVGRAGDGCWPPVLLGLSEGWSCAGPDPEREGDEGGDADDPGDQALGDGAVAAQAGAADVLGVVM